jgi:ribonuclease P protein component
VCKSFDFPREERLKGKENFKKLFKNGKRIKIEGLTLIFILNNLKHCRMGISLRGVKGSVIRNRIKRKLRELYRLNKSLISRGLDIIFMPSIIFMDFPFPLQMEKISSVFKKISL